METASGAHTTGARLPRGSKARVEGGSERGGLPLSWAPLDFISRWGFISVLWADSRWLHGSFTSCRSFNYHPILCQSRACSSLENWVLVVSLLEIRTRSKVPDQVAHWGWEDESECPVFFSNLRGLQQESADIVCNEHLVNVTGFAGCFCYSS